MNGNTMKKKLMSLLLVAAMVLTTLGVTTLGNTAYAAENEITVYVTISDKGQLAVDANGQTMAYVPVTVPADANGTATVDAVMVAFHDVYCPGGYVTEDSAWGKSVSLLWNVANNYGYSFAIDNVPLSLGVGQDLVGNGGHVYGYIMKDTATWSDTFAYAQAEKSVVGEEETTVVTFSYIGYDPVTWAQSVLPLANVTVKAAGSDEVLATTDAEGKAEISFAEAGTYIVYAENPADAATTFSAPACVITVEAEDGEGGGEGEEPPILDYEEQGGDEDSDDEKNTLDKETVTEDEPADEEAEETEKAPATGDASQMAVYLIMMMVAAGAMVVTKKQK